MDCYGHRARQRISCVPFHCGTLFIAFTSLMLSLSSASAGDLRPEHIPADAKWLVHVDQETLSEMPLVKGLREMHPKLSSNLREWFNRRYGIDPQDGMRSITMFSRDYKVHTGVVLLETEYDADKLTSMLRSEESLKTTDWKGRTLFTITLAKHAQRAQSEEHERQHESSDGHLEPAEAKHRNVKAGAGDHDLSGGKQMTVYLGDELIVFASSVPNAKSVLRLLDGDAKSLEGTQSPLVASAPDGAVIYGAAIELGKLKQSSMLAPVLQQHQQCVYAFGEHDGKLFETLTLTAKSEEVAAKMTTVLEGLIACEQLWAAGSESLTELMNDVQISRDANKVTVNWEGDSELVLDAVVDLKERADQWLSLLLR